MKKPAILFILPLCFPLIIFSQDSLPARKISVSGNIQLTNNGTSPVPIFALGKPAVIGSYIVRKGRFFFNGELFFGLDAKPWTINTRVGYYFVDNDKASINLTTNLSLFFLKRNPVLNNNEEFQLQRYWTNELNGEIRISRYRKIQFQYWHTISLDNLGVAREEFPNVAFLMENLSVLKKNIFTIRPILFYLYDEKMIEGVFIGQTLTYQRLKWWFNLFVQTTVPIHVVPSGSFLWNGGINVPF